MRRPVFIRIALVALILTGLAAAFLAYDRGRPVPVPVREQLFRGVTYTRSIRWSPRPMVIHVISIDMRGNRIRVLVTPADEKGSDYPLRARTTSQFLQEYGVQIAVNGDGFSPWWSHSVADYYPHIGDPVRPRGFSASRGRVYWTSQAAVPTLYISSR